MRRSIPAWHLRHVKNLIHSQDLPEHHDQATPIKHTNYSQYKTKLTEKTKIIYCKKNITVLTKIILFGHKTDKNRRKKKNDNKNYLKVIMINPSRFGKVWFCSLQEKFPQCIISSRGSRYGAYFPLVTIFGGFSFFRPVTRAFILKKKSKDVHVLGYLRNASYMYICRIHVLSLSLSLSWS